MSKYPHEISQGNNSLTDFGSPYERLDRQVVAKGSIIDYCQDTIRVPNGMVVKYDHIEHRGAAAVVPVLPDGRIVMVRQYRNSLDRYTLEIPAGGLNSREEPTMEAARRELQEETGYSCGEMELLITLRTTVAFCNEKIDIYYATDLKTGEQHLDEDEFVNYQAMSVQELTDMIYNYEIEDSKTIAAILAYKDKYL